MRNDREEGGVDNMPSASIRCPPFGSVDVNRCAA